MKRWKIIVLLLLIKNSGNAQTIEGRVWGRGQRPLPLVSVVLTKDTTIIVAGITNDSGYFRLATQPLYKQAYTLRLSLTGYFAKEISFVYPDTTTIRQVVLMEDQKILKEVSITGKPPLLIRKSDRSVLNVENGPLANGFSATDVLQRTPGVWVDNTGNIRLKGTQPVTIMVDDVVQRMGTEELADFLRSLKSEDISRIEIIPNPPSEFEADGSGGIIHIILKKGKKNGWGGSVNTEYWQQGQKPYFTTGASLSYQHKKLYLHGSFGYTRDLRNITERTSFIYPDSSAYNIYTGRAEKIERQQYRFSAVYDLSTVQSVSVQSFFSTTRFNQLFQSSDVYDYGQTSYGQATSLKHRVFHFSGITLNYSVKLDTLGRMLKITADLSDNERPEKNAFNKRNDDIAKQRVWRTDAPIGSKVYTLQSDFTQTFHSKTIFRSGIKYASISRDNQLVTEDLVDSIWIQKPSQSNHFVYAENILMLYASVEQTLKHATIKAGLRGEETFSDGNEKISSVTFSRKYLGLYPSISMVQTLNAGKATSITASYARRLTRPALNELNPARMEFSNYTAVTGNPNLLPENSHHFSLVYQFLKNHSAEFYLIRTNNYIALSANPGANNSIDYYSENTGSTTQYGFEYSSTISPIKAWTINTNFSVYRLGYQFNDKAYRQTTFYAQSFHTFTLAPVGDIDFIAEYRSPYIYTNLYTYANFSMDLGFTKKLFKTKAKLRLAFTDLLNTSREKEWTEEKGNIISFYRKRPTRTARLSFTYMFSSGKKVVNKIIDPGAMEEKKRIGN
jgi:outer membrane receptor protein involved in Fe transport